MTDGLTGLYNRRFFEEQLSLESQRAERGQWPIGMLIIDVDRFKQVNDTYGHPVGDLVLRQVAERLRAQMRGYDVVARYGGEEFAVLIPDVDQGTLLALAERLRRAVSADAIEMDGGARLIVTVSVGVASQPADQGLAAVTGSTAVQRLQALVKSADRALYEAKRAVRNRCVVATPEWVPMPALPQPRSERVASRARY